MTVYTDQSDEHKKMKYGLFEYTIINKYDDTDCTGAWYSNNLEELKKYFLDLKKNINKKTCLELWEKGEQGLFGNSGVPILETDYNFNDKEYYLKRFGKEFIKN